MVRAGDRVRGRLQIGTFPFEWGVRTYVMGIVNVTPDSFSGDGVPQHSAAIGYAAAQRTAGADILDVGGESTRPGHERVADVIEIERILPVIRALRSSLGNVPISVDTYKPAVLRAAHAAGANVVNSIWGAPDEILELAAELEMPVVAMHNQHGTAYEGSVVDAVLRFLEDCARRALLRGIPREAVVLDPGIGFGKTPEHNVAVLQQLDRLVALGFPTMLGTSRKSTLGLLTGRGAPHERVYATVATTALAVAAGIDLVRVHDVAAARDAVAIADAVVRNWRPAQWMR